MSLSTTQYGYIVDPMVPFTDDKGKTIKNGFIRVFMAGTSTPVLTYRNYDGATNQEKIELDNSGRVKHNVICSKGSLYKVVVYNILHSQENPLLTVDKIAVLGASINASGATIVTGLDSVTVPEENFLKATVEGTGVEFALDPTEVTSDVNTISAAETAAPDYVVPLLDKTGTGDGKKISLANLFKFALDLISRLATTVTSFASGDYFAVSNTTNGARKMSKDTLLELTAQNALAGNVAPAFVPNSTTTVAGLPYIYNGLLYVAKEAYQGPWDANKFEVSDIYDAIPISQSKKFSIIGANNTAQNKYFPICDGVNSLKVIATPNPWDTDSVTGDSPRILSISAIDAEGVETELKYYLKGQNVAGEIDISIPSGSVWIRFFVRANSGVEVSFTLINSELEVYSDNLAKKFVPNKTRTIAGYPYIYGNKVYIAKIGGYIGLWDAIKFEVSDIYDAIPISQSKKFSIIGANITAQNKYFPICDGVNSLKVIATPNPWDTDTIGGSNPTILSIDAIDAFGVSTNLKSYGISATIPSEIKLEIPNGTTLLHFFVRANSGVEVEFSIVNTGLEKQAAEVDSVKSRVSTIETDVKLNETLDTVISGKNATAVEKEVYVKGLDYITVIPSPNPWPQANVGSGVNIFIVTAISSTGTTTQLKNYLVGSTIPKKITFALPNDTEKIRYFVRADSGSDITIKTIALASKPLGDVESVAFKLDGVNLTSVTRYVEVSDSVDQIAVDITPTPWGIDTIGGSNPTYFQIKALDDEGISLATLKSCSPQNKRFPFSHEEFTLPEGTARIEIFFRANYRSSIKCSIHAISKYAIFSNEDVLRVVQNAYSRKNVRRPQCLIVGDPHGSSAGFEAVLAATNESNYLDFVLCVGDICYDHPTQDNAYDAYQRMFDAKIPVIPVVGNHDVGSSYYVGSYLPIDKVVENVMGPAIDKGYIPSNSRGYYYKDFDSLKLRLIVVNQYEISGTYGEGKWEQVTYDSSKPNIAFSMTYSQGEVVNIPGWTDYSYRAKENVTTPASAPSSWSADIPCWSRRPDAAMFGQTQAQWIADTLLATPENYGVCVVTHTVFSANTTPDESCKFTTLNANLSGLGVWSGTDFLANLVDAFVNGENYFESVEYLGMTPFTVSCDFSKKNAGVKFVGFLGGHFHTDIVFRHNTKNLYAFHTSSIGSMSDNDIHFFTDVNRFYCNFTVASMDCVAGALNLIKIGLKLTSDGVVRDSERLF